MSNSNIIESIASSQLNAEDYDPEQEKNQNFTRDLEHWKKEKQITLGCLSILLRFFLACCITYSLVDRDKLLNDLKQKYKNWADAHGVLETAQIGDGYWDRGEKTEALEWVIASLYCGLTDRLNYCEEKIAEFRTEVVAADGIIDQTSGELFHQEESEVLEDFQVIVTTMTAPEKNYEQFIDEWLAMGVGSDRVLWRETAIPPRASLRAEIATASEVETMLRAGTYPLLLFRAEQEHDVEHARINNETGDEYYEAIGNPSLVWVGQTQGSPFVTEGGDPRLTDASEAIRILWPVDLTAPTFETSADPYVVNALLDYTSFGANNNGFDGFFLQAIGTDSQGNIHYLQISPYLFLTPEGWGLFTTNLRLAGIQKIGLGDVNVAITNFSVTEDMLPFELLRQDSPYRSPNSTLTNFEAFRRQHIEPGYYFMVWQEESQVQELELADVTYGEIVSEEEANSEYFSPIYSEVISQFVQEQTQLDLNFYVEIASTPSILASGHQLYDFNILYQNTQGQWVRAYSLYLRDSTQSLDFVLSLRTYTTTSWKRNFSIHYGSPEDQEIIRMVTNEMNDLYPEFQINDRADGQLISPFLSESDLLLYQNITLGERFQDSELESLFSERFSLEILEVHGPLSFRYYTSDESVGVYVLADDNQGVTQLIGVFRHEQNEENIIFACYYNFSLIDPTMTNEYELNLADPIYPILNEAISSAQEMSGINQTSSNDE